MKRNLLHYAPLRGKSKQGRFETLVLESPVLGRVPDEFPALLGRRLA